MSFYKKLIKKMSFLYDRNYDYTMFTNENVWTKNRLSIIIIFDRKNKIKELEFNVYDGKTDHTFSIEQLNSVIFKNNVILELYYYCSIDSKLDIIVFLIKKYITDIEKL